jgi:hypothetical protein
MDDTTASADPGRAARAGRRPHPDDPVFALSRPPVAPPVRPVPEWRAEGRLREAYGELRAAMRVPWVGVITQALARWEPFYLEAWDRLRPAAESEWFARGCDRIARLAAEGVRDALPAPDLAAAMRAAGYGERELAAIRATLDALNHGNPQYLVYATAVRYALAGAALGDEAPDPARLAARASLGGAGAVATGDALAIAGTGAGLMMVEEHHALADVRAVYADIKAVLDLPFVNSDYKAMARWPTLLAPAWASLRPLVDTPAYARLREALHREAVAMAIGLPLPYRLDRAGCAALGCGQTRSTSSWPRFRCSSGCCPGWW